MPPRCIAPQCHRARASMSSFPPLNSLLPVKVWRPPALPSRVGPTRQPGDGWTTTPAAQASSAVDSPPRCRLLTAGWAPESDPRPWGGISTIIDKTQAVRTARSRAQSRTSNLPSRTSSIPWGKHGASLAQWVTAGCQSMDTSRGRKKPDITRKASPVQYPSVTSLLPMSLRLGGWPAADTINSRRSLAGGIRSG